MTSAAKKQLRHVFAVISGATPASGNPEYWDGDIRWATPEDISSLDGYRLRDTRRKITRAGYESCGTTTVPPGSIVLSKRAPIGQVAVLAEEACSNQGCFLLTPRNDTDTRFFYYWLSVQTEYLQVLGRGSTFMELSTDELKSLNVPHPSLQQQRAISDYLDSETARLDALVAAKERVLGLLAEKRRALITGAVTRGLDPRAPLRDSGIPWLSEIPKHWGVKKLAFLASLRSGDAITAEDIRDDGPYAVYGGNGLRGYTDRFTHDGEYVLIGRQGALCGNINYSEGRFWPTEHAVVVTPRERVAVRWLGELLRAMDLNQYSASAAQPGLSVDTIATLRVPIPPFEEQDAIVEIIGRESERLDKMRDATERTISLLEERRGSLIAAAVTGQFDVGNAT